MGQGCFRRFFFPQRRRKPPFDNLSFLYNTQKCCYPKKKNISKTQMPQPNFLVTILLDGELFSVSETSSRFRASLGHGNSQKDGHHHAVISFVTLTLPLRSKGAPITTSGSRLVATSARLLVPEAGFSLKTQPPLLDNSNPSHHSESVPTSGTFRVPNRESSGTSSFFDVLVEVEVEPDNSSLDDLEDPLRSPSSPSSLAADCEKLALEANLNKDRNDQNNNNNTSTVTEVRFQNQRQEDDNNKEPSPSNTSVACNQSPNHAALFSIPPSLALPVVVRGCFCSSPALLARFARPSPFPLFAAPATAAPTPQAPSSHRRQEQEGTTTSSKNSFSEEAATAHNNSNEAAASPVSFSLYFVKSKGRLLRKQKCSSSDEESRRQHQQQQHTTMVSHKKVSSFDDSASALASLYRSCTQGSRQKWRATTRAAPRNNNNNKKKQQQQRDTAEVSSPHHHHHPHPPQPLSSIMRFFQSRTGKHFFCWGGAQGSSSWGKGVCTTVLFAKTITTTMPQTAAPDTGSNKKITKNELSRQRPEKTSQKPQVSL